MQDLSKLQEILLRLDNAITEVGPDLAVLLVIDSPSRLEERPSLHRVHYAVRTDSRRLMNTIIDTFRALDAYVEVFDNEKSFIEAIASHRIHKLGRRLYLVRNGVGWGITRGGFRPGMRGLIPALADSYGLISIGSSAYSTGLAQHKYHSFLILKSLGLPIPRVWHYRSREGWMGNPPPAGLKIIAKSTYEAWAVGVTPDSVFTVDGRTEKRLTDLATAIGQPVTLQEFISGREVYVPAIACPDWHMLPPVEQILTRHRGNPNAFVTIDENLDGAIEYSLYHDSDKLFERLRDYTFQAIDVLQIETVARLDYRIDVNGKPWLTDVATSPSWSDKGALYTSVKSFGFDYPTFLRLLLACSLSSQHLLMI